MAERIDCESCKNGEKGPGWCVICTGSGYLSNGDECKICETSGLCRYCAGKGYLIRD